MATYEQLITTPYTSTGDDVYAKPVVSGDVVSSPWDEDDVAALEIGTTNTYAITVDETKAYIVYLNVSSNAFTVNAGTDVFTKTGHGLANGETVRFLGADLPEPLEQSTIYYIRDVTTDTFKIEASSGSGAIDILDVGSGTIRYVAPSERSSSDQVVGSISKIRDSELVGEAEFSELLAAIKAKTDLIGTAAADVHTPVTLSGTIRDLIVGADYLDSNDNAVVVTMLIPEGTTIAGSECTLKFVQASGSCDPFEIEFEGVLAAGAEGYATLTFDLPKADTATITEGEYYPIVTWVGDAGEIIRPEIRSKLVTWKVA